MAVDMFLKLDGIKGEAKDDKHKDEIHIESFSWGLSQTGAHGAGGGGGAGKVSVHDISITKFLDKASPELMLACCNGKHIPKVTIELCRETGSKTKYMEYKLEDVIVTSMRPGGSSGGSETLPLEEVSFNYGKISWTYTGTDQKTGKEGGRKTAWWSTVENKGGGGG